MQTILKQPTVLKKTKYLALKQLLILGFSAFVLASCQSENPYFKFTFTDELNPTGLLPEYYEVSSNGKLVVLTNRFNENHELYHRCFFTELSKNQLDSVLTMVQVIRTNHNLAKNDSMLTYIFRYDELNHSKRASGFYVSSNNYKPLLELNSYCSELLVKNKRYDLDHSYYFNTDEFCFREIEQ